MRVRILTTLGAAAVCAAAAIPALPASAAKRSQCQRLTGVDRAPDRNVKLVKRPNKSTLADGSRGSDLVGCLLPRGKVFAIATRKGVENDLAQEFGYLVRQVAGRIVLVDQHGTVGGYGNESKTMVWDLQSGLSYTIARSCFTKDVPCYSDFYDFARNAFVTRDGRAATVLEYWGVGVTVANPANLVVTFGANGAPRALDAGAPGDVPAAALALKGNVVSWMHGSEPRSANL